MPLYIVLCIFTFCTAAGQFVLINMGLERFDGTLFYPMYRPPTHAVATPVQLPAEFRVTSTANSPISDHTAALMLVR